MQEVASGSQVEAPTIDDGAPVGPLPTPVPSAGAVAYARERELALASSAAKRENYARYMASSRRSAQVDYLPIRLDIENVSRCNYRCTMCIVSDWPKGRRGDDMCVEDFKQLIDEQYGLVEIKLNGLGEALMQGDPYFEMIRYARSKHIWVRMVTNGSLLHLKDNYKKLIDTDVNEVDISIDGADKATYESIRRGGKFEQFSENCATLNRYCEQLGITRTKSWTLVQEANKHQLPEIVDLCASLGFKSMVFSLTLHGWGHDHLWEKNSAVDVSGKLRVDDLWDLVKRGKQSGVDVAFWSVNDKFRTDRPETLCPWPFQQAVVTSDLRTVPCCMIGDPDAFEIGRGSGKPFSTLWKGEEFEAFRQAHLDGRIPAICQGCYHLEGSRQ